MHKIKYCIVCLSFLYACKNDQKTSEGFASTNNESATSVNTENNNSSSDATFTTPAGNSGANTTSNAVAPSTSVLATPNTSGSSASGPTTSNAAPDKMVFGKSKASETYTTIMEDDKKIGKGPSNLPIPDPCTLISTGTLNANFGLTSAPEIKNGSKTPKKGEKSCFFKFGNAKKPNAGIMLQIMTNPYPEEIDDYPSLIIEGKIKDGEQSPYDKIPKRFKSWNELGDGGCYSYEAGKYHWKIGNKYLFLLAFNTDHSEAQQKQIASVIAKEAMKNFSSK